MRILLVEGSGRGFLTQYSHALALGLHRADIAVTLITGERDELVDWPMPFEKRACLGRGWRAWFCLARLVRRERPHVVHLQWIDKPLAALAFVRYAQRLGVRVIYTPHNILPHERRWLLMPLFRVLYRRVDRVVARDRQLAWALEELLDTPRTQLAYVPGSPSLLSLSPSPAAGLAELPARETGEFRVLFFGHGCERKGLDLLLDAVAMRDWSDRLHLVVAGEDVLAGVGEEAMARVRRRARLTTINRYIPPDGVAGLFRSADLLVMPYVKLCKSPLCDLAAALGLPVLRSDRVQAAGFREGINGVTIAHANARELAAALGRLLSFPALVHRMGHELNDRVSAEAALIQLAERHLRLYDEVCGLKGVLPAEAAQPGATEGVTISD